MKIAVFNAYIMFGFAPFSWVKNGYLHIILFHLDTSLFIKYLLLNFIFHFSSFILIHFTECISRWFRLESFTRSSLLPPPSSHPSSLHPPSLIHPLSPIHIPITILTCLRSVTAAIVPTPFKMWLKYNNNKKEKYILSNFVSEKFNL